MKKNAPAREPRSVRCRERSTVVYTMNFPLEYFKCKTTKHAFTYKAVILMYKSIILKWIELRAFCLGNITDDRQAREHILQEIGIPREMLRYA